MCFGRSLIQNTQPFQAVVIWSLRIQHLALIFLELALFPESSFFPQKSCSFFLTFTFRRTRHLTMAYKCTVGFNYFMTVITTTFGKDKFFWCLEPRSVDVSCVCHLIIAHSTYHQFIVPPGPLFLPFQYLVPQKSKWHAFTRICHVLFAHPSL